MTEAEWLASDDPVAMLEALKQGEPCAGRTQEQVDRRMLLWVGACRLRWPDIAGSTDLTDQTRLRQACEQWAATHLHAPASEIASILRDIVGNPWRPAAYRRETRKEGVVPVEVHGGVWPDGKPYTETQGVPWLTPTVLALAEAAYAERPGRECSHCHGNGKPPYSFEAALGRAYPDCKFCNGAGRIDDGSLDPDRLAVLADALEEAGCDDQEIIQHLRGKKRCGPCEFSSASGAAVQVSGAVVQLNSDWTIPDRATSSQSYWPTCKHCHGSGWRHLVGPHVRGCWVLDLILGKD